MDSTLNCHVEGTNDNLSQDSMVDLQTRHRKERRDLQSKIQAIKKNAPKADKKKRKEALDQIAKLEADLEQTHLHEIEQVEEGMKLRETSNPIINELTCGQNIDPVEVDMKQQRMSKAQKRREKKDRVARQKEEDIKSHISRELNTPKAVETQKLLLNLKERKLALFHVPSDGDCLYNAVRHQLLQFGLADLSIIELRNKTSNFIKLNKNSLIPYMTNPESGEMLTDIEFEKYCEDILQNSSWGGEIELKALSSILKMPIEVLQADGSPTLLGVEFESSPLIITYHRHLYSLGEHYNSTIPLPDQATDEESE